VLIRLDDACTQAQKLEPDRTKIKTLIGEVIQYARLTNGFAEQLDRLAPHLQHLGAWLGHSWTEFSAFLGL
jgi:hypothetical protein